MMNKKNSISFLCFLLVFLSISGRGISSDYQATKASAYVLKAGSLVKDSHPASNGELLGIEGILQSSLRVDESNHPSFETFKKNKREFNASLFSATALHSRSFYSSYQSARINNTPTLPFYIAHRRLII